LPFSTGAEAHEGAAAMIRSFGWPEFLFLVEAARWTVGLSAVAFVGGAIGGAVIAVARVSSFAPLGLLATGYIQLFQGTPLLMQLFLAYFGAGILGVDVGVWGAAVFAFTLYASAFLGEIWRGSIQSVPKTQWEASASLALSYPQQLGYVILPQAVRIALPPTVGFLVQVIKSTSLASIIGFTELTRAGQLVNNVTFQPFLVFLFVAALYFAMCWPLAMVSRALESRAHGDPAAQRR
jgi:polar amino acid transport system permease protein